MKYWVVSALVFSSLSMGAVIIEGDVDATIGGNLCIQGEPILYGGHYILSRPYPDEPLRWLFPYHAYYVKQDALDDEPIIELPGMGLYIAQYLEHRRSVRRPRIGGIDNGILVHLDLTVKRGMMKLDRHTKAVAYAPVEAHGKYEILNRPANQKGNRQIMLLGMDDNVKSFRSQTICQRLVFWIGRQVLQRSFE